MRYVLISLIGFLVSCACSITMALKEVPTSDVEEQNTSTRVKPYPNLPVNPR